MGQIVQLPNILIMRNRILSKNDRRRLPDLGRCHMGHGRLILYMLYDWETKRWTEGHLKLTVLASKMLGSDIFVGGRELPQNTIFQI